MKITEIKGVGPKTGSLFENLGLESLQDLLLDFPTSYEDRRKLYNIEELDRDGYYVVKGQVLKIMRPVRIGGGRTLFRIKIDDLGSSCDIIWYNQPYLSNNFKLGKSYFFYGQFKKDKQAIYNPAYMDSRADDFLRLIPKYRLTKGLSNNKRIKVLKSALELLEENENKAGKLSDILNDRIPQKWRAFFGDLKSIVKIMHFPKDEEDFSWALEKLKRRKALEYIFLERKIKSDRRKNISLSCRPVDMMAFLKEVPFSLNQGQKDIIKEIGEKLSDESAMRVLLQGDVGSGKTIIALAASYMVLKNGYSVAIMAPTEILAGQHYLKASKIFDRLNIKTRLITGSDSPAERMEIQELTAKAGPVLYIGTHALFQKNMNFQKLALVITDEQHRFGVIQRKSLEGKGFFPNVMMMTATPIPRTMSQIAWGDMDLLRLKELPAGRKKIITRFINAGSEQAVFRALIRQINKERQVYIVCPAIEDKEEGGGLSTWSVDAVYKRFKRFIKNEKIKDPGIEKLSGKQDFQTKKTIMDRFNKGEISLLISTTVIEVGLDVKNAGVMVIFAADRFGLAQLHQLRGRVGRGDQQGYCLLISDKTSGPAKERLLYMEKESNGWEIAKKDLYMRGAGDRFGKDQHGFLIKEKIILDDKVIQEVSDFLSFNGDEQVIDKGQQDFYALGDRK